MSRPATTSPRRRRGGDGILIDGTNENVIRDSLIVNNGPYDGIGVIAGAASNGNIIENNFILDNNIILDNNVGFTPTNNQDIGIRLEPATIATTVQGNVVENSGLDGIQVFGIRGQRGEVQRREQQRCARCAGHSFRQRHPGSRRRQPRRGQPSRRQLRQRGRYLRQREHHQQQHRQRQRHRPPSSQGAPPST
jgi:hypothetical protein